MTLAEFKVTLAFEESLTLPVPMLIAPWYDARGDWETAHEICQAIHAVRVTWVHVYLPRKEGDMVNTA